MVEEQMQSATDAHEQIMAEAEEEARWMEERLNGGFCPSADGSHCEHWWEASDYCHRCGHHKQEVEKVYGVDPDYEAAYDEWVNEEIAERLGDCFGETG